MNIEMQEILQLVQDRSASDLHLKTGQPPVIRVSGKLLRSQLPTLTANDVERLVFEILTPEQRNQVETNFELDASFGIDGVGRFRINVFKERGNYAAAFRVVPSTIPSLKSSERLFNKLNAGVVTVAGTLLAAALTKPANCRA